MAEVTSEGKLPKGFLIGVASSGYQCEGGYNGPGEPENNWADFERQGRVMTTGMATDFWNRHEEDFQTCQSVGMNAFRLSIEWPRVQPRSDKAAGGRPDFDTSALDHYAGILAAARKHGLEPVVTLQHFTHPAWLGTDAWLENDTPQLFAEFVRYSVEHLNRRLADHHGLSPIKWYVTLNEPNMLVLNTYLNRHFPGEADPGLATGVRAYNRLLSAHVLAYNVIHDLQEAAGWGSPMVTMNTFCSDAYWSENMLLDLLESRHRDIGRNEIAEAMKEGARDLRRALIAARLPFPSDPFVWIGRGIHLVTDRVAPSHATAETFAYLLDTLEQSPRACVLDYLGLDYYDPFTGHIFRPPSFDDLEFPSESPVAHLMSGLSRKWWDWQVLPEGLHFFCKYYAQRFAGRGLVIAENGMAMQCHPGGAPCRPRNDKVTRSKFLSEHLRQVLRIVGEGIPLLGYLHWSITDNYEWGSYTPRFGLVSIDYSNDAKRVPKNPNGDQPLEVYREFINKYI